MRCWLIASAWLLGVVVSGFARDLAAQPANDTRAPVRTVMPTPQFRRYGLEAGVPSGPIYSVAQDHRGLLWFGAAGGLVRFDGVDFKVFRHVAGDPTSLPANQSYALFVDNANRIWTGGVATGLTVYDQSTGRFRHWEHDDKNPASLSNNEVWGIAQTADGRMWLATQGGLDRLLPDESGFEHVALGATGASPKPSGPIRALLAEADGRLWIGAESGLYLRHADGKITAVPVDPAFSGDIGKVWHIEGGRADVRVAVTGGLLVIGADGVARPLAGRELAQLRILSSARDAQRRLWLGTLTGLVMDDGEGALHPIGGQSLLPGGLPSDRVWQVLRDREGGLWFTFENSGIAYLAPNWDGFTRFTHIPDDPTSLAGTVALSVQARRDGTLWVGGSDGWVDKLDPRTGKVQHVVRGLRSEVIALAEDFRERLWIVGPGQLHLYDHGKLTALDLRRMHIARPTALATDGKRLYLSSWGAGVFAIDMEHQTATPLVKSEELGNTAFPGQLSLRAGRLWYASAGGMQRSDEHGVGLAFVPGVPKQDVGRFDFDAADGFWTVNERTLEHYRGVDGQARLVDHVDISAKNFAADLRKIRVDRQGRVWLFADPGLWRYDPGTRQFREFGAPQGLSNAQFSNGSTDVAADGTLFAASNGGVMAFQPERLEHMHQPDAPPLLTLTRVAVRRDGRVQTLPVDGSTVILRWDDRDVRVRARLSSFIDPAANKYRYWLHGFDSDWVNATSRGERDFTGLRAGSYTLEVNAAGADGQWHALAQPLQLKVQAPPWARWWAWLAYVLVAGLVLGSLLLAWRRRLAVHHHLQMLEQQRQLAEAASAAKTRFLATLSHEIRTPMTGVMGMAELLLGTPLTPTQHDYTRTMQRSGAMLLKLLNDALDLARIEAGRLELEPAPFNPRELLDEVMELERGLAQIKGIHLQLQVAEDLPAWVVGDALRIKQVLLNLANNALKFTEHGSVTVSAQRVDDGVLFRVTDTGPGIPEASQMRMFQRFEQAAGPQQSSGSGLGLAICRELVNLMKGTIELESELGGGSTFRVCLPLGEPPATSMLPLRHAGPGRCCHVLLVEDDSIVAAVIRGLLEGQGHCVCHVTNGLAVLAEMARTEFDAVLLDLDLPRIDGFQVARLIRQREHAARRVPIIAVTARSGGGGGDEARARAAGMDGFLRKPLTGEQLADALARVLGPVSEPRPA
ncbi:MAG TPA: ATP-binding protein [Rhodanobacter sp.]